MPAISEKIVAKLPAPTSGNKLHYFSGATLQGKKAPSGFAVRVTATGTKSFVWFHRVGGKPYLETIGRWDENVKGGGLTVLRAIMAAKARADAVQADKADPRPQRTRAIEDGKMPAGETVADMLDEYVKRYVEREGKLRGADTIKRTFERLVKPVIGELGIYDLRRSNVVKMLDKIADDNGPVMADRTLAYVRKAFNWRAARDDNFSPPIAKGMARTKSKERARDRILGDAEIRELWAALNAVPDYFARYTKFLLHTAARRTEASAMQWSEIDDDTWIIPGARYKTGKDTTIPLTDAAYDLLGERPKDPARFVFSASDGKGSFSHFSLLKAQLDTTIAELRKAAGKEQMPAWTLHDLRRTARSLMSRAGIAADIAERCLGHVIAGVRGVYDRHQYDKEKREAFEALAAQINRILHPTENITDLAKQRRAAR